MLRSQHRLSRPDYNQVLFSVLLLAVLGINLVPELRAGTLAFAANSAAVEVSETAEKISDFTEYFLVALCVLYAEKYLLPVLGLTFFKIMLPLAKPGLSTLLIYDGVNIWNEFSFALTLTQTSMNRTLPLAVNEYQGQYTMNIPMIMTVLFVSILPMIIVFIFAKDKLIEGMMAGAVKG